MRTHKFIFWRVVGGVRFLPRQAQDEHQISNIGLPRQARDKHQENDVLKQQNAVPFFFFRVRCGGGLGAGQRDGLLLHARGGVDAQRGAGAV